MGLMKLRDCTIFEKPPRTYKKNIAVSRLFLCPGVEPSSRPGLLVMSQVR